MPPLMLDLFAGLGGASEAMRRRGWEVVTVDNDPVFNCTVTADLAEWSWQGRSGSDNPQRKRAPCHLRRECSCTLLA